MRTFYRLVAVLLFVGLTHSAHAQTVTATVLWTQPSTTVAQAQSFVYGLKMDATVPAAVMAPTCTSAGINAACQATVPFTIPSGSHTFTLSASNSGGTATSDPITFGTGTVPSKPTTVTITILVTVP